MKSALLPLTLLFLSFHVTAQRVYSDTRAFQYFDKDWHEQPEKENAAYVRIYNDVNASLNVYEIRDQTIDGQLLSVTQSSSKEQVYRNGLTTWYNAAGKPIKAGYFENNQPAGRWMIFYNNGQRKMAYTYLDAVKDPLRTIPYQVDDSWDSTGNEEVANGNGVYLERNDSSSEVIASGIIKNGLRDGRWEGFSDGKKRYEEDYCEGVLVRGLRFDAEHPVNYYELNVPPAFTGGEKALAKFLDKNLRYPTTAYDQRITGTVMVRFIVQEDGTLTDIGLSNGASRPLNEEAIRVVRSMPNWQAGTERGKRVPYDYTLPVDFKP